MTDPREEPETELPLETERALELALRSAWQPAELDPARHEALLALCLEDPFAEPTPEEVIESERLRRALDGEVDHPDAALARALRASHSPSEASDSKRPLPELPKELDAPEPRSRGRVVYVAFGAATTLLAAAAAIALVVGSVTSRDMSAAQKSESAPAVAAAPAPAASAAPGGAEELAVRGEAVRGEAVRGEALSDETAPAEAARGVVARGEAQPVSGESYSRSSAPLFHEPFTLEQTTARIDRIAAVRERELRSNLYRSWGLK